MRRQIFKLKEILRPYRSRKRECPVWIGFSLTYMYCDGVFVIDRLVFSRNANKMI